MAQSEFAIGIRVDGAGEAQKQFSELEKSQKSAAKASSDATKTASDGFATFGNSIKDVGKDLDNFGLDAGKTFAMTTEGIFSVVGALSAGGVTGLIGAATVAAGALIQLANAHKTAEEEAAKQFKTYKDDIARVTDLILASRKVLTNADFERKEAELLARRGVNEGRFWDEVVARDKVIALKRVAAQLEAIPGAGAVATKQWKDAEAALKRLQDERAAENLAIDKETRANRDAAAKADGVAFAEWQASEDKRRREERAKVTAKAAEDLAKNQADWLTWTVRQNLQAWDAMGKAAEDAARMTLAQQEAILAARDAARDESLVDEDGARAKREEEDLKRLREYVAGSKEAALAAALRSDAERELAESIQLRRDQDTQAIVVQAAMSAETMAYGVAMSVVQPMVQDFTASLAVLGTINRENYRDLIIFSNELPAIIAREVQARLGAMGAEATGKAIMSSADGLRETAIGFGMLFVNPADAAAHFTAAGVHFAAASAYGTLGTGALVGAGAIGSLRGAGGPIALTSEEQDTINMRRDEESGSWVPTSSGSGGGMSGDNGAFVVNITNEAGSIAPDDQRRAARVVASSVLRARSNAFDRRRMGA